MSFDGSLFPCPLCEGKCFPVNGNDIDPRAQLEWIKCLNCGELWSPMYVRAFWAGYAKREKEINE